MNTFSRDLSSFCTGYGMFIVNDGDFTYIGANGWSIVDHFFCSHVVFDVLSIFCIGSRADSDHPPLSLITYIANIKQGHEVVTCITETHD